MVKKQTAKAQPPKVTPTKAKVVIEMAGGLIRQVVGNRVDVDIAVVDYDADDVDPEDLIMCPTLSGDGDLEETYAVTYTPEESAQRVEDIFKAIAKAHRSVLNGFTILPSSWRGPELRRGLHHRAPPGVLPLRPVVSNHGGPSFSILGSTAG